MVQYQYFTNEFGISDTECGSLLGFKATLDVVFGMAGGLAVDAFGVRKTTLFALAMAICGRFLLAFGRTKVQLYTACLFFSPFGEAFLMVGIYKVALYKLTTPRIRPFAFGVQYSTWNFSGALANVVIDGMRHQGDQVWFGMVFTGLRRSVITTWVAVLLAMGLSLFLVQDVDVLHPDDPEKTERETVEGQDCDGAINRGKAIHTVGDGMGSREEQPAQADSEMTAFVGSESTAGDRGAEAAEGGKEGGKVRKDKRGREGQGEDSVGVSLLGHDSEEEALGGWCSGEHALAKLVRWRREAVAREAFEVMLPGLSLMAASSVFLVVSPTVSGAVLWISFLTLGEAFWSPRWMAWVMELAPGGREGVFVAVSSLKDLVITWPSLLFIGWLNARFNPNCSDCRDDLGHFCALPVANGSCASPNSPCPSLDDSPLTHCPATCLQCPGYQARPFELWSIVLGFSLLSPLLVWLLLPFLRGVASPLTRKGTTSDNTTV